MTSSVTRSFRSQFNRLPPEVQALARKQFSLWQGNPRHPSLRFRKVGPYWSVRVSHKYRALAVEQGGDFLWFYIGPHKGYETEL